MKNKPSKWYVEGFWRLRREQKEALRDAGFYTYDLRSWDDGGGTQIEKSVLVNYEGTIVTNFPIDCIENGNARSFDAFIPDEWKYFEDNDIVQMTDCNTIKRLEEISGQKIS